MTMTTRQDKPEVLWKVQYPNQLMPVTFAPGTMQSEEDLFRIPFMDKRGHSVKRWLRLHPNMDMAIGEIVDEKQFPIRNFGDFLRIGANDLLNKLHGMGWVSSIMASAQGIMAITQQEEYYAEWAESMGGVENEVIQLRGRGKLAEAEEYISKIWREIEKMPEGGWRERYIERMKEIEGVSKE